MNFNNFSSSDWQNFVYSILILMMLVSSIASRKEMAFGKIIKYLGIWSAITFMAIIFYSYRFEFSNFKNRILGEINPTAARVNESGQIIINLSQDGHFYIDTKINGQEVHFMIDTGASDITLSVDDAKRVGINLKKLTFNKLYQTANGESFGANITLQELTFGNITFKNVSASVNNGDMGTSLMGMSFLRKFKKYEFYQDRLVLTTF